MIQVGDRFYDQAIVQTMGARAAEAVGLSDRPELSFAVCLSDPAEFLALLLAIREAGASVLPIHPSTPRAAARRLAIDLGCHRLVTDELAVEDLGAEDPGPGGLLQTTSGTTGEPKRIARSWAEIDREIDSYVATFVAPQDMTPLIACPITHSYGLICGVLVALRRGQVPHILGTANPKYLIARLRQTRQPLLYSSPAMLHAIARLLPAGEMIHAAMTSGTLLPDQWLMTIRARTTHLFQQYGCSEAGCVAINPNLSASGDMGAPLPHLRVEAGDTDQPREIVVHVGDRAIRTADLGYTKADGTLVFVGRLDDTINVSGLNVYPKEVEDVVMAMPGVTDAVVFRRLDSLAGERVAVAFSAEHSIAPADLRDWCIKNLAAHQVPMETVRLPRLPRQANGKISRREIAALHAEGRLELLAEETAA
ncbi:2-succinylbenzoate--CoA ligase [Rhodopseudomonas palustris]|uniref:AMP-binding protein n=1 Tax=Rhodopseudomonas palustris (strain ATCC BAA-98 / CGA009) TaxID=258594 RepID=Q6N772_RHOPA|nr:AMP-binding protein [Rhodopseudomonas palustris]OPF90353.1 acyl-CoA synthetase [Rhodopseudomonas palustris]QQM03906.1 2-succinylbenzoate--CoA ligase [Rhodopseudomonas palustris]RJF61963.1 acyl-CoA synthetase [Rhodopseudomonas palustris]WAB80041.1 AMP-binding protein [Rhodopseudomonas palustris]WCL92547.1 AMP-binding protein [Rhodopseudomonas palustris CGA009]